MKIASASILLLLAACSGASYTFPTKVASSKELPNYHAWKHELAPNPEHHFSILIPNEWKILQTTVAQEPEGDRPLELALFREPAAWIDDPSGAVEGEIVVEVFALSGSELDANPDKAPTEWLKEKLRSGNQRFKILQQRTFLSANGQAADLLLSSGGGDDAIISRMTAVRSKENPTKIFVVVSSATADGYERVAQIFATAAITFRLTPEKVGSGSVMSVSSTASSAAATSTAPAKIQLHF